VQPVLVECHTYGRVDSDPFKSIYFPLCLNPARGNDWMRSGTAQLLEPLEIDSSHRSFAIHVGAEKCGAEGLKLLHDLFRLNLQSFTPTLNHDVALGCVQRHDNCRAAHSIAELAEKWNVYLAILERSTSDNDLVRAPIRNYLSAPNGANSSTDTHSHPKVFGGLATQFARQFFVIAVPHGSIQIDDVQPLVLFEFHQQRHHVRDRELPLSPVDELHRLPSLQVNARN